MVRPFRVEVAQAKGTAGQSPTSQQVDHILRELHSLRSQVNARAGETKTAPVDNAIALWSGVDDIQQRIEVTKSEIASLRARGVSDPDQSNRTAAELQAVVTGTEAATDTILAAAERIDAIVQGRLTSDDRATTADATEIAACVVQIFEACNFQDITGQRITKVVESLQFIEERISSMVDVWQTLEKIDRSKETESGKRSLVNGPALEGDGGIVSQDDVDALFS